MLLEESSYIYEGEDYRSGWTKDIRFETGIQGWVREQGKQETRLDTRPKSSIRKERSSKVSRRGMPCISKKSKYTPRLPHETLTTYTYAGQPHAGITTLQGRRNSSWV